MSPPPVALRTDSVHGAWLSRDEAPMAGSQCSLSGCYNTRRRNRRGSSSRFIEYYWDLLQTSKCWVHIIKPSKQTPLPLEILTPVWRSDTYPPTGKVAIKTPVIPLQSTINRVTSRRLTMEIFLQRVFNQKDVLSKCRSFIKK